jgi:hypothetical protein
MKFVFAFVALMYLSQFACAQPNYQDAKPLARESKPGTVDCPLYFKTEDLCANYSWIAKPTEDDMGSFSLKFWNRADSVAKDPALALKVVLWMPDMGHGSSPVKLTKVAVGDYLVENVFFSMRGNWQIRFQLKNAQAVTEEQIADVSF